MRKRRCESVPRPMPSCRRSRAPLTRTTPPPDRTANPAQTPSDARLHLSHCCNLLAPLVPIAPAQSKSPAKFDQWFAHGSIFAARSPRPATRGLGGARGVPTLHPSELKAAGIDAREQPFDAMTPLGVIKMTNVIATIRADGRSGSRWRPTMTPSSFGSSGSSAPATAPRQPRRFWSWTRAEGGGRTTTRSNCCSWIGTKKPSYRVARSRQTPNGARYYVRREAGGNLAAQGARILDMIGDRSLASAASELHTLARRHRLDVGGEAWLQHDVHSAGHRPDRGRSPPVPRRRRAVGRYHRPQLPAVAHGAG